MYRVFIILAVLLISCNTPKVTMVPNVLPTQAKNIILLVGDGMGLTQISAGMYMNDNQLNFERFPVIGLHKNYSYDNLVTDSAAGATAFACGVKSYNGAIGVDQDTMAVKTILEEASEKGLKTGLVAASSITHATPASFAAHNKSRQNMEEIAADMIDSGVDIMIGGGKAYFDRRESDERYLSDELAAKGYKLSNFIKEDISDLDLKQMGNKWVYYTADKEPLSVQAGRDYLIPASEIAIESLSEQSNEKGFFVMIEGSQIDWAGHANNFPYMVSEILEFDQVIKQALDFAEKDGNTLVIVTADHETGGLAIATGSKMNEIKPAYTSDYHTATMIPVFAYGPGSELFSGIYENTDIYYKMKQALGLNVK